MHYSGFPADRSCLWCWKTVREITAVIDLATFPRRTLFLRFPTLNYGRKILYILDLHITTHIRWSHPLDFHAFRFCKHGPDSRPSLSSPGGYESTSQTPTGKQSSTLTRRAWERPGSGLQAAGVVVRIEGWALCVSCSPLECHAIHRNRNLKRKKLQRRSL